MQINILTKEDAMEINGKLDKLIYLLEELDYEAKSAASYTNEQLAIKLRVSKKTLQNWRDQGLIGFAKVGRKIFYTQDQIVDFLNSKTFKRFK